MKNIEHALSPYLVLGLFLQNLTWPIYSKPCRGRFLSRGPRMTSCPRPRPPQTSTAPSPDRGVITLLSTPPSLALVLRAEARSTAQSLAVVLRVGAHSTAPSLAQGPGIRPGAGGLGGKEETRAPLIATRTLPSIIWSPRAPEVPTVKFMDISLQKKVRIGCSSILRYPIDE